MFTLAILIVIKYKIKGHILGRVTLMNTAYCEVAQVYGWQRRSQKLEGSLKRSFCCSVKTNELHLLYITLCIYFIHINIMNQPMIHTWYSGSLGRSMLFHHTLQLRRKGHRSLDCRHGGYCNDVKTTRK